MMSRRRLLLAATALALVALAPLSARAADLQTQVRGMVNAANLGQTEVGVLIVDLSTGKTLASINSDEPMIPASNMKLVTTAAALKTLPEGPDFTFRTELRLIAPSDWPVETNPNAPGTPGAGAPPADGAAAQPAPAPANASPASAPSKGYVLVIRGDGDPALGDPVVLAAHGMDVEGLLLAWVNAVKDAKVDAVDRIVVDDRVFDHQFVHPTWPAGQLNRWYCAQVAGVNFYDNCIDVFVEPTKPGQPPSYRLTPGAPFLSVANRAITGEPDFFVVNRKNGSNELMLSGKVKNRRLEAEPITVHDPAVFFAQLLAHRLAEAGVPVSSIARPTVDDTLPDGKAILAVENTLPLVIGRCNKDSQNLFAESLFKRMGRAVTGAPGSFENGSAAVRLFLRDTLGASAASVVVADGSGMSRENRLSPRAFVSLLGSMRSDPDLWPIYRDSLSIDRFDGATKRRFRDVGMKLQGELYPKTGFIAGVCTLSGYLVLAEPDPAATTKREHTIAYSLLFNDIKAPASVADVQRLQDNIVRLIDKLSPAPAPKAPAAQAAAGQ
jgi:D-alanyl-D-alanine carboxypeptidase/D-alanyl-D-alanine-endopeptidase (penicillin-binding protein 4)